MARFTTVDAHCGGAPLRLLVEGAPTPRGRTMREKMAWMARHADELRRTLMREPRGHRDMVGALFTEPVDAGSHAGLIFMNGDDYLPFAGHGAMAAAVVALDRGLILPGGLDDVLVLDTVAGAVTVRHEPRSAGGRASIALTGVPSFVAHPGLVVQAGGRRIHTDVAYGGAFYAIVDAESAGVGVSTDHLPSLRHLAADIVSAVEASVPVVHPVDSRARGVSGVLFTGPAGAEAGHLRSVTVLAGGAAGRGPSISGMAAVLAVLDAMGLVSEDAPFSQEGLSGACFGGRIASRTMVADRAAIVPEIEGTVWLVADQRVQADPDDPFVHGLPD